MTPEATLKLVVAWPHREDVSNAVRDRLLSTASSEDVRQLSGGCYVVWSSYSPSQLRDLLRSELVESDGLLVVEFETWSGYGKALDQPWLLAHGH